MHNGKRKRGEKPGVAGEGAESIRPGAQAAGYEETMIEHVRMVTSLFEGRKVSRQEVLKMLEREEKRQQGIPREKKTDYLARELTEDSS